MKSKIKLNTLHVQSFTTEATRLEALKGGMLALVETDDSDAINCTCTIPDTL